MCRVTRAGGSKADIERRYQQICSEKQPRRTKTAAEAALEAAAFNIEENNVELNEAFNLFNVINTILQALGFLGRFFPPLRLSSTAARAASIAVSARLTGITAQRSANDRVFQIVQQAAANEARFRLRAGE